MSFTFQKNLQQALLLRLHSGLRPVLHSGFRQFFNRLMARLTAIVGVLCCCALLTGCVDYQVGIQFDSPNQGQLTHRIKLDNYTNPTAQAFLQQVRQQTQHVQGSFRSISQQESLVTIPFHTAHELEHTFNQFFQTSTDGANGPGNASGSGLPTIVSNLSLDQRNWLLFEHDRLTFDLDLRSLGLQGTESFADPGTLFNLKMAVNSRTWDLNPGQKNHIVTDLWMPMPLGWGTAAIVLLVVTGIGLRKRATSL